MIAKAGERVIDDDGRYLCSVKNDIRKLKWISSDLFADLQIDFSDPIQRLPVTLWLVRRILASA